MRRRDFVALVGSTAAAWPLAASAQQAARLPTVGFLGAATPESARTWVAAFVERMRELGWTEGRTVAIEYRWAEGRTDRMADIAAEFVRIKTDVIVAQGTQAALAAKQATPVIPVVFALPGDPVGTGLVGSLSRPGGNVTGLSSQTTDLTGKRLDLLRAILPNLRRLVIMVNVDNSAAQLERNNLQDRAGAAGLDVVTASISKTDDIAPAFASLKGSADALYIAPDALMTTNRVRINTFALVARLPTMYGAREYVEAAGLISYGPDFRDLFRRAADYVDKILRGAKAADLPVQQPTKFELVVNQVTAKALDIVIPSNVLAIADEVIE
jgi:putative tryptophan/tyrosine transport system substrate-binding protein